MNIFNSKIEDNEDVTTKIVLEGKLKLIGENSSFYFVEAYWWVRGMQYERRAILKLGR